MHNFWTTSLICSKRQINTKFDLFHAYLTKPTTALRNDKQTVSFFVGKILTDVVMTHIKMKAESSKGPSINGEWIPLPRTKFMTFYFAHDLTRTTC